MMHHDPTARDQFLWLEASDQARLAAFKAYAVNHALLEDVDRKLTQAILEPAGFAHVLVYGPSGVGKSTVLRGVNSHIQELAMHPHTRSDVPAHGGSLSQRGMIPPSAPAQPLLVLEARPPDGQMFSRIDHYRSALIGLGEAYYKQWSLIDIQADRTWETMTKSRGKSQSASSMILLNYVAPWKRP